MIRVVRYCKRCYGPGKVIETRESAGVIVRRLKCEQGHRFTTVEVQPATKGKRTPVDLIRELAS